MSQEEQFKLDMHKLSAVRVNKNKKKEHVLENECIFFSENGKFKIYHIGRNEYFPGDLTPAVPADQIEEFVKDIRWKFSKLDKGKDIYPPTPFNIDVERKKAYEELVARGGMPSQEEIKKIYTTIVPTHMAAEGSYKKLQQQYDNAEEAIVARHLRGD